MVERVCVCGDRVCVCGERVCVCVCVWGGVDIIGCVNENI